MKYAALGLALVAVLAALRSAYFWHKASRVNVMPMWEVNGRIEPVDPHQSQAAWTFATIQNLQKSGLLNQSGAFWAAISVAISGVATVLGALS